MFLLSQTKNDLLWDPLKALMNEWRHRRCAYYPFSLSLSFFLTLGTSSVIVQWNAMCMGFTARAVRLLYGPTVGAETIVFQLCVFTPSSDLQQALSG